MSFRITAIETRIVHYPLVEERIIVATGGRHDSSRYLAVRVRSEDGVAGFGEAATTPLWSGETAETAQCAIQQLFAPLVMDASFDHPAEVLVVLDRAAYGMPFTKSSLETAMWDMWARSQNMRACSLFGDREPLREIPTRASVGCYDVPQTVRIATEFYEASIRTLKFKVGVPGFEDAARLRAVRQQLGDEVVFTVDANGAYSSVAEAVTSIEALMSYNLQLVEQPTPRERISLLAEVKKRVGVPIMADECIFNPNDLREVLDCDACDIVSLYPGKNGGVAHTVQMAQLAQQFGKPCTIGSNLETDLGQATMAAVAAGVSAFSVERFACDLPATLFYQSSSVCEPLELTHGKISVPTGNGFGVTPRVFGDEQN